MYTKVAIEAFIQSREAKNLSKETIKWYVVTLKSFAVMFDIMPEEPSAIEAFLKQCPGGDERRHGYFRALRALYRFVKRFQIPDIMKLVEPPKRKSKQPRPLSIDALDQLLSFPHPRRIQAAITFMIDTGARVGETARLGSNDLIETEWGHIVVVNGKTGERFVPISESTYRLLRDTLPFNVLPNRLCHMISKAFKEAHVQGTAHTLRHSFGTYWDGDETVLQRVMGHSTIQTTQIYRKLRVKKMCELHREYSPLRMIAANRQANFFKTESGQ
jgi:integrase